MASFQKIFGRTAITQACAPGRVNLLGEHTDYNDGYVLPTAIPQRTVVEVGYSIDDDHHFYADKLDVYLTCTPAAEETAGFASYVVGCIKVLEHHGYRIPPVSIHVSSAVPIGSGLSSSAALEVAVLRALRELLLLEMDDVKIAQLAQQAEIEYAHVNCGIMDQMASSLADTAHMLFLDTRTLERRLLPLPAGAELIVIDSGIPRTLAGSAYNERRAECEAAAELLEVKALRDVSNIAQVEWLPPPLAQRARHVVSENSRVLEAVDGIISAEHFGTLMNASHASLRDDFMVSTGALDTLVDIMQSHKDVFGARLTGAGFGGACVALAKAGAGRKAAAAIRKSYNRSGHSGDILVPVKAATARRDSVQEHS
ncbi:MAG: galactokinase [Burkholderiales bacterium]